MDLWPIECIKYNFNISAIVCFVMLIITYMCVSIGYAKFYVNHPEVLNNTGIKIVSI
jgi:hypothetical protein